MSNLEITFCLLFIFLFVCVWFLLFGFFYSNPYAYINYSGSIKMFDSGLTEPSISM